MDLWPQYALSFGDWLIRKLIPGVPVMVHGLSVFGISWIKREAGAKKCACNGAAQITEGGTRWFARGNDFSIDIFRHASDETMRTTKRGPTAKDQAEGRGLGCSYGRKRLHDVPVLFDEGGAW